MSNIIKSSRVVEREEIVEKIDDTVEEKNETEKVFIEEARKKYDFIIQDAQRKAIALLDKVQIEVEEQLNGADEKTKKIFKDSKEKGFEKGHVEGCQKGYEEGFEKGYKEGKEVADNLISEALDIKKKYLDKKACIYKDIEEDVIKLVISIYEKIFYEKIEQDDSTIVSLVLKGLDSLDITDNITIIVSKEDVETVKNSKDKILAKASLVEDIDIKGDNDLNKGDCIIETSKGNVDIKLKEQLEELKELLLNILSSE